MKPVPPGYRVAPKPTSDLVFIGFGGAGVAYLLTLTPLLVGQSSHASTDKYTPLLIPAVGPFVAIDTLDAEGLGLGALVALGVAQCSGIVMGAVGIGLSAGNRLERVSSAPTFVLAPGAPGAGLGGLSARVVF